MGFLDRVKRAAQDTGELGLKGLDIALTPFELEEKYIGRPATNVLQGINRAALYPAEQIPFGVGKRVRQGRQFQEKVGDFLGPMVLAPSNLVGAGEVKALARLTRRSPMVFKGLRASEKAKQVGKTKILKIPHKVEAMTFEPSNLKSHIERIMGNARLSPSEKRGMVKQLTNQKSFNVRVPSDARYYITKGDITPTITFYGTKAEDAGRHITERARASVTFRRATSDTISYYVSGQLDPVEIEKIKWIGEINLNSAIQSPAAMKQIMKDLDRFNALNKHVALYNVPANGRLHAIYKSVGFEDANTGLVLPKDVSMQSQMRSGKALKKLKQTRVRKPLYDRPRSVQDQLSIERRSGARYNPETRQMENAQELRGLAYEHRQGITGHTASNSVNEEARDLARSYARDVGVDDRAISTMPLFNTDSERRIYDAVYDQGVWADEVANYIDNAAFSSDPLELMRAEEEMWYWAKRMHEEVYAFGGDMPFPPRRLRPSRQTTFMASNSAMQEQIRASWRQTADELSLELSTRYSPDQVDDMLNSMVGQDLQSAEYLLTILDNHHGTQHLADIPSQIRALRGQSAAPQFHSSGSPIRTRIVPRILNRTDARTADSGLVDRVRQIVEGHFMRAEDAIFPQYEEMILGQREHSLWVSSQYNWSFDNPRFTFEGQVNLERNAFTEEGGNFLRYEG